MASKQGISMATNLLKTLTGASSIVRSNTRSLSGVASSEVITSHTEKWMQVRFSFSHLVLYFSIDVSCRSSTHRHRCCDALAYGSSKIEICISYSILLYAVFIARGVLHKEFPNLETQGGLD
ncbi:hypothetical protein KY290_018204 [Solanum tuberosum]|uniref:Uncharacterized protein n=1 Tax=Solanum tuberosum TaxID=4113 RepID=A0ABQ7VDJ8_SOLTU|nr:hypothetical protein KY284_017147 [Solanum tuberosum]KAH0762131.1 hypothetical protein KY290_018204 [Solanum tuberosum]